MKTDLVLEDMVPFDVQTTADTQNLGTLIEVYPSKLIGTVIASFLIMIGGLFFLASGLLQLHATIATRVFMSLAGLIIIGSAIYMIYTVVQAAGRKIYRFQRGIVIARGNQIEALPWNQTTELWQAITRSINKYGRHVGTRYSYTLKREDGYVIRLNKLTKNIEELGPTVAKSITRDMAPRAFQSIQNGETLNFARFTVSNQGLGNGREVLPWTQVLSINMQAGKVTIWKPGLKVWEEEETSKIPNVQVFMLVANKLKSQAEGSEA